MNTVRLTMAQAVIRYLTAQKVEIDGEIKPLFAGCWAIFGHGNVAGLGEAPLDQLQRYFQSDGIHPNAEGVARIVQELGPAVLDLIEDAQ